MRLYFHLAAAACLSSVIAFGQPLVGLSAKIGVPVTEAFDTNQWGFLATGSYQGSAPNELDFVLGVGF